MREVDVVSTDGSPDGAGALGEAVLAAVTDPRRPALLPVGPDDPPVDESLLAPVDDAVALVVTTSGSTGAPKGVLLPGAALRASTGATHARLGGPGRWLLALPAHHVAGVQVMLRSGLAGLPPVVMDLRGGFRADGFARAAAGAGDARYVSLVPTQLRRLLDAADEGAGDGLAALRGFAAVLVGGAAADAGLLDRARAADVAVVTTYGMSETCGGCVYDGRPLDGVEVTLDEGAGDEGADGSGRITLGGPTVAAGYRGAVSPAEAGAFTADGRFRTSDLGRWDGGRLEVLGRADDMIVTGGENVAPARVERALLDVDGVAEACVVGVPDAEWGARVVAAVVVEAGAADLGPETVRAGVASALGRAAPREVRVVAALPLRGIGKPDRAAVRRLFVG